MQDGLHLLHLIVGALVVLAWGLWLVLSHRHKMPAGHKSVFVVLFVFSSCGLVADLVRDRWPYAAAALLVICIALLPFGFWLAWKAWIQQLRAVGLIEDSKK